MIMFDEKEVNIERKILSRMKKLLKTDYQIFGFIKNELFIMMMSVGGRREWEAKELWLWVKYEKGNEWKLHDTMFLDFCCRVSHGKWKM